MATPPAQDHIITVEEAAEMTQRHRENFIKGGFFWKEQVLEMLQDVDSIGMRYYYGINADGKKVLILTAVDGNGDDLYERILLEFSLPCPPTCSADNPLNS